MEIKVVITLDIYKKICRLWMSEVTQRQIAARLHIPRNTVKKYCDGDTALWIRKTYHRESSVLTDDTISFVQHCLDEDKLSGVRKQQHTAKRIYDRLVEKRHFISGKSTVRRLVQQLKERTPESFVLLAFPDRRRSSGGLGRSYRLSCRPGNKNQPVLHQTLFQ